MLKPLSKLLIIITMLVAFFGQVIAGQGMAVQAQVQHENSTNSSQHIDDDCDNDNDSCDVDCCQVECCETICICPTNTCSSMVYLDTRLSTLALVLLTESLQSQQIKAPRFIAAPFYRPPISFS
ncbi:hypothetical protein [Thalassotalea sp. PLHSN55]|uniref:hypothetical protein n=1 Tax=Thalassotalea sp. PLHSN55 TaxID=3435888 RepID=UPI003F85DCC3